MKKVLISLIGGQTIPNVLLINEMNKMDEYIFIHTSSTKRQADFITSACAEVITGIRYIEVGEYNTNKFDEILIKELVLNNEDKIHINLTGGTKIMSIGAYNFFLKNFPDNSIMYYCEGGKNQYRQVYPIGENNPFIHKYKIPLHIYFRANGIAKNKDLFYSKNDILSKNSCLKSKSLANKIFDKFSKRSDLHLLKGIYELQSSRLRGKSILISNYSELNESLLSLSFEFNDSNRSILDKNETKYLTGDWFEEYVFYSLKDLLGLEDEFSVLGINSKREEAPNEYDILLIINNDLYYIECKSTLFDIDGKFLKDVYNEALYKAAALRNEFGTFTKCFLFSSDDFSKLDISHLSRAEVLRVNLIGKDYLENSDKLKQIFRK